MDYVEQCPSEKLDFVCSGFSVCLFFSTYDSPHTMQWKTENIKSHPTSTLNIYIKDFSLSILTYYLTSTYPNYSTVCDFSQLLGGF